MSSRLPPNVADLLEFLGSRFDFEHAEIDDVNWIASAGECVSSMSMNLSGVLTGLGCLVSEDSRHPTGSGAFTADENLPALLWNLSDSLDTISRLSSIVNNATFYLQKRQSKPEKPMKKAEVRHA